MVRRRSLYPYQSPEGASCSCRRKVRQVDRTKKPKKTRRIPTRRLLGKTLGMGVQDTWVRLFLDNGYAPRHLKMTDEELSQFMIQEFERNSKEFRGIQWMRAAYNRGRLTIIQGEPLAPRCKSYRYDEDGDKVIVYRGMHTITPARKKAEARRKARRRE